MQVRNRFEALQTDAEEILTNDETVDPIWPEAITKKQDQNRRNQTHKRRVVSSKLNTRGNGKETSLCPLERGKMRGNTEEGEEWKLMPRPLVIDSGAAETVMPTDWFTGHEMKETEESRGGQFYVCAGGKEITNYGERTLTLSTLDWSSIRNMTFQVTDVTKALGSVSKIVANGNKVVFDGSGRFIENKRSRERLWMREDNGVYVLDVYVAPPDDYDRKGFLSQAGTSLASSLVRPLDEKSRKGVSGSRNNLVVLSEAGPAADDQMESDSDMSRERILRERERRRHEDQSCSQQGRFR